MATWTQRTEPTPPSWGIRPAMGMNFDYDFDDQYDSSGTYDGAVGGSSTWSARAQPSLATYTVRTIPS